jgi:hypothetical protein
MSRTPDNIDRFNRTVVALLDQLYSSFPTPIEVNPLTLGHLATPQMHKFQAIGSIREHYHQQRRHEVEDAAVGSRVRWQRIADIAIASAAIAGSAIKCRRRPIAR